MDFEHYCTVDCGTGPCMNVEKSCASSCCRDVQCVSLWYCCWPAGDDDDDNDDDDDEYHFIVSCVCFNNIIRNIENVHLGGVNRVLGD